MLLQLTDIGVRHLVTCCRELQTLNLNYVMALQSAAVCTIGELQLPLRGKQNTAYVYTSHVITYKVL